MLNSVRNEGTTSAHVKLFLTNYTVTYLQKFRYLLEVPQEFINRYYFRTYRWVVLGFFYIGCPQALMGGTQQYWGNWLMSLQGTLNNLWMIMVTGRNAQILEESKCHFHLQEGWEKGPKGTTCQTASPEASGWWGNNEPEYDHFWNML